MTLKLHSLQTYKKAKQIQMYMLFSACLLLEVCRHTVKDPVPATLNYKNLLVLGAVTHHYYPLLWRSINKVDIWFITEVLK